MRDRLKEEHFGEILDQRPAATFDTQLRIARKAWAIVSEMIDTAPANFRMLAAEDGEDEHFILPNPNALVEWITINQMTLSQHKRTWHVICDVEVPTQCTGPIGDIQQAITIKIPLEFWIEACEESEQEAFQL